MCQVNRGSFSAAWVSDIGMFDYLFQYVLNIRLVLMYALSVNLECPLHLEFNDCVCCTFWNELKERIEYSIH